MPVKVAVCQVPDIREDIEASLRWIEKFTRQAEDDNVSLICFPECFLQGYLTDEYLAKKYAVNLTSSAFKTMIKQLIKYKPVIVFGLIEEEDKNLYNTAVVIKEGKLIGKYRKTHLLEGEQLFKTGSEYPIFEINDLKFGINICYDTQFPESVANVAKQGAKLILCPSNNMMRYETAEKYKHLHHEMRIERVKENKVWLLSADVTGEREGRIAYGPTSAINPDGKVVAQAPLMETGMVTVEIAS
jgi:5-aminopentanamidase